MQKWEIDKASSLKFLYEDLEKEKMVGERHGFKSHLSK